MVAKASIQQPIATDSSETSVTKYDLEEGKTALYWAAENHQAIFRGYCGKGVYEVDSINQSMSQQSSFYNSSGIETMPFQNEFLEGLEKLSKSCN